MVGLVVLAGGQSRRMGQDKARMAGGIRRILTEAKAAGLTLALCSQDLSRVVRNSNERMDRRRRCGVGRSRTRHVLA